MRVLKPAPQRRAYPVKIVKTKEEIERQRREEIETIIEAKVAQALRILRR